MVISEKIFWVLEDKKMSQKEFAERTGISQSTISDWKRKKTNPSSEKIMIICEVLQISPYDLLEEEEGKEIHSCSDRIIPLNREESILLETYRDFAPRQKERLMGYLSALKDMK